jgi:xylulokinase
MSKYLLSHDLGTSGNKAVLFALDGKMVGSMVAVYPVYYPAEGYVEQSPGDWWKAVCVSTKSLLENSGISGNDVAAVSFSGQMMGCLIVDDSGEPLRNSIIWADTRAANEEEEMIRRIGMEQGYRITGHRLSASYSAAKLLWLKNHENDAYKKAFKMLNAKDYIIYRLTGNFITDYSDASGTNLFNITEKKWDDLILSALEIPVSLLPDLHSSTDCVGKVTREAALATGLAEGTPVIAGGGDGSCACVGAGVVGEESAYNVLGSSSWVSRASKSPVFDKEMRTFNWVHLDPALYTPCGTMQAAGYSYTWYRNTFCGEERAEAKNTGKNVYALIDEAVSKTEPGAGGLLYLPYILGERSPRWNSEARGVFAGFSVNSTKGAFSRAVLEGVGFNLKIILDTIEQQSADIEKIMMIGGGAKGRTWLQILSDIWRKTLVVPRYTEEATGLGASVCAGIGCGAFDDFKVVAEFNPPEREITPNRENEARYDFLFTQFDKAYHALLDVYSGLAEYNSRFS